MRHRLTLRLPQDVSRKLRDVSRRLQLPQSEVGVPDLALRQRSYIIDSLIRRG